MIPCASRRYLSKKHVASVRGGDQDVSAPFSHSGPVHADEAAAVLARQRPEERAQAGRVVVEADRLDAHLPPGVPLLLDDLAQVVAQQGADLVVDPSQL